MLKLDLEKAEKSEIKLPTSIDHCKNKRIPEKHLLLLYWLKPLTVWIIINCGKFKRWEHQTIWPAYWKKLYAGQEAAVRTGHGTTDWFQIGKGVHQDCILSPCLFNLYAEYIIEMPGWMKHQLESRLLGEISITSDMQMTPPLWQKVKKN